VFRSPESEIIRRPAHFHFIVSADGHVPVVTELFSADDPCVERDAVFGVRESLVVPLCPARIRRRCRAVEDRGAAFHAGLRLPPCVRLTSRR